MEIQVQYTKPSVWKRVVYFILMIIPVIFMLSYAVGFYGIFKINALQAKLRLHDERVEIIALVWESILLRMDTPAEKLALLKLPKEDEDIAKIAVDFPEITEIYRITEGKVSPIYTKAESAKLHDIITKAVVSVYDTLNEYNFGRGYFTDYRYPYKRKRVELEGDAFVFTYVELPDEIRLIVTAGKQYTKILPEIMAGGIEIDPKLYQRITTRYPEEFVEVKFYDTKGVLLYTFGTPKGEGWDDIMETKFAFFPLIIKIKYYPTNSNDIYMAENADIMPWKTLVFFIVALICIILLGHFSARLHGFSVERKLKP